MMMFLMFAALCAAAITNPMSRKVTNARKKCNSMTKLNVISVVSKAQTRTVLTIAARITLMTDITRLLSSLKRRSAHVKEFGDDITFVKLEDLDALVEELEKAQQRIAELGSRTVKLPKRSVGEVMHMSGFSRDYAEGWCAGNDNAIHEIQQVGIAVENNGCWYTTSTKE
ncbi:hypothetical protein [Klebsiella aerogenes]|uniref:hypothetical protein n=1 Tax=Klebsiella aerogenes TaxID=548 RepID=UPI0035C6B20F